MTRTNTSQLAWSFDGNNCIAHEFPCPDSEVMPGIFWGLAEDIFSPAFWKHQSKLQQSTKSEMHYRLGKTLLEEVAVCLLGGYGMPAELGLAAFNRLQAFGLLNGDASVDQIEDALTQPFSLNGKSRKYRFPKQKSRYLSEALRSLRQTELPDGERGCRDYLITLKGIGPKTASWIIRNHFGSDLVAILDIHIIRAGVLVGFFDPGADPAKNYFELEDYFLKFCEAIEEPASQIDALMWDYMRRIGPTKMNGISTAA